MQDVFPDEFVVPTECDFGEEYEEVLYHRERNLKQVRLHSNDRSEELPVGKDEWGTAEPGHDSVPRFKRKV